MPVVSTPIPALRGLPILGCLLEFRRDRLGLLRRAHREGGDIARVPLPGRELIVVTAPDLAKTIFVDEADAFRKFVALARYARPMLGDGLLASEGETHRRQRRRIAPGLRHGRIGGYVAAMSRHAEDAARRWTDGATIDVHAEMTRLALGIAAETMFGSQAGHLAEVVGRAVHVTTAHVIGEMNRVVHLPLSWPLPRHVRLRRAIQDLDAIVRGMIGERRASGAEPDDLLTMLLRAQAEDDGSTMTDEQVRDEVMTLFLAGHETTANALTWSLSLLARHPEAAARLAEEARGALGGRPPGSEDLPRLPYALRVFKEALRLYPPAYLVGREATRAVRLRDHEVPAGATVIVSIHGMHRREDAFPDPERFDPDRFLPEREKALPRGAYIPFADGPRICVGNHFALMEGQAVLAHLAQRVRLSPVDERPPVPLPQLTLRPRDPVRLRVTALGA